MNHCDLFASVSHFGFAVFLVLTGAVLLRLTRGHGRVLRWAVGLYALSAILLYIASGMFHGVRYWNIAPPELFRRFDLCGIFLLIVGSYLPVFAYLLSATWRNAMTAVMVSLSVVGMVAVWVMDMPKSETMVPLYALMSLIGLVPLPMYLKTGGRGSVVRMVASVVAYATGGVCEVLTWPTAIPNLIGPHEVLHLTDILGTLIHLSLVMQLVQSFRGTNQ